MARQGNVSYFTRDETMKILKTRLVGVSPLIMHSDRGANPLDPDVRAHKILTSKRKKTDEDHEAIARSEWRLGLYWDKEKGPYIPGMNARASLVGGAKFNKLGATIKRSTIPLLERIGVEYEGPREVEELIEHSEFTDVRSVGMGQSRIMRCRPIFRSWSLAFDLSFDPEQIEEDQLKLAMKKAGSMIGLGDYRPEKGGLFGRYEVEY